MTEVIIIIFLIIVLIPILICWLEAIREDFDKPPFF